MSIYDAIRDLERYADEMDRKKRLNEEYGHQPFRSPYDGVAENFAVGVYESPGNTLSIVDEFSPWGSLYKLTTGNTIQEDVNSLVELDTLKESFTPEEYGASDALQGLARFAGQMVADEGLLGAAPYTAYRGVRAIPQGLDNLMTPTPTGKFNQGGMLVWQGSPHKYDGTLDPTKIGTGEGAQAYGYGHYVAENPSVARSYMYDLSSNTPLTTYKNIDFYETGISRNPYAREHFDSIAMIGSTNQQKTAEIEAAGKVLKRQFEYALKENDPEAGMINEALEFIQNLDPNDVGVKHRGNLYKFDLDDNAIANMLDWDDVPYEGSPMAQTWMDIAEDNGLDIDDWNDALGLSDSYYGQPESNGTLYNLLASSLGGKSKASAALQEHGIPGIKYYDGNSRAAGEGTRNYVVFPGNENLVKALERNGEPLGTSMSLPMDEASRMQRARDMGFDTDVYHGTTHDIYRMDASKANPESDWGQGIYTSTSIDDVNPNYAGEGPDLTNRIQYRAEQIAIENDWDYDDPRALEQARQVIKGESEGAVYPLKINTHEYAVIGGDNPTVLYEDDYYDLAKSELDIKDFADDMEFEDAVYERMEELKADDPDSLVGRIVNAFENTDAYAQDQAATQTAMIEALERAYEGELNLTDLDDIIRSNLPYLEDAETGAALGGGHTSKQVLENLGFKGVIDNQVNDKFGWARKLGQQMEGIDYDTQHIITFPGYENTIRSDYAKFDPAKFQSSNLLDSRLLPIPAGLLGLGYMEDE